MDILSLKRQQLEQVACHREDLRANPRLRWLFFELTDRCNLRCRHCGSDCTSRGRLLSIRDIEKALTSVQPERPMICLTGGEPLLHPDFFEIAKCIRSLGLSWGMTTNATLIDDEIAYKLRQAEMSTVSISLDGMEHSHDLLRGQTGAWRRAICGIRSLQKVGFKPQVSTVFHRENFGELDSLYAFLRDMGIDSWRTINVEPIGRACEAGDLLLTNEQFVRLLRFIREKRFDQKCGMEVTFGCSHYLGTENERMVRDHYFLCGAGILVAGVRSNGDICACLDIEPRKESVQGNIKTDDLMEVWQNGFRIFRRDRTGDCARCMNCSERFICGGDSTHTWDFVKNEPLLCYQMLDL